MSESQTYNEKELLLRIAEGDEDAFRQLHDHYWEYTYPVALGFLKSTDLAMDVLQEVFIRIWNKRESLPEIIAVRSYILTAVRNEILSHFRKEERRRNYYRTYFSQLINSDLSETDSKIRTAQIRDILEQAIEQLPQLQRKVLLLSRDHELSHAEIADRLNIDKKSVTNAITRALNNIRIYLKQYGEDSLPVFCLLITGLLK